MLYNLLKGSMNFQNVPTDTKILYISFRNCQGFEEISKCGIFKTLLSIKQCSHYEKLETKKRKPEFSATFCKVPLFYCYGEL